MERIKEQAMKLLHINSSANPGTSLSRRLTAAFVEDWRAAHPGTETRYRDLNAHPAPPVTSDLLKAIYAPEGTEPGARAREALETSNALVEEFLAADAYVFGVPMYNFSVPGSFKAWIDHVVRMGRTWTKGPKGMEGLVKGRKMLIVSTRSGDYGKGGPREAFDFHEPYLRKVFGLVGIDDLDYVAVIDNPAHGDPGRAFAEARARLKAVAERWRTDLAARRADADDAGSPPNLAA
jgi:FMN-dependent NADH-azoreductase